MVEHKTYNKLVRDKIPEIIESEGRSCGIEIMSEMDYQQALKTKLLEEAQEAIESSGDDLVKELADVLEVIDALMMVHGIERDAVLKRQQDRHNQRGGFAKRIKLLWTK